MPTASEIRPHGSSVDLVGIQKDYGENAEISAVSQLDLSIDAGEFVTLLGPSGAGKTTVLRILAGLERPDQGRVSVDNTDITSQSPQKRRMGVVFQNYALFPHMTVGKNVSFGLRVRGKSSREIREAARNALSLVRLEEYYDRYPAQLSGGEQQRVAIARTLVYEPRMLLMDEPLGALDKNLREHLQVELRLLQKRLGVTCVYITHDQDEAMALSDRIGVMNKGRLLQVGTPQELYERPSSSFVAGFFGKINFIDAALDSAEREGFLFKSDIGTLEVDGNRSNLSRSTAQGTGARIGIRPEHVQLQSLDSVSPNAQDDHTTKFTLDTVIYAGSVAYVHGHVADGIPITVQLDAAAYGRMRGAVDEYTITLPKEHLMAFNLEAD